METSKLQKIDVSLISDHSCLESTDHCYFFGEYTGRQGFNHSEMNQLVWNFKKPMEKKGKTGWHYKGEAIKRVSELLITTDSWPKLKECMWVPIPPAYKKEDAGYDDRVIQVLQKLEEGGGLRDIREILSEKTTREQSHIGARRTISDHLSNLVVDQSLLQPKPGTIVILDDVITSGASFKAAQILIRKEFPGVPIAGIFIARNVRPEINMDF